MTFQTKPTTFDAFTTHLFVHKDHIGFILGKKCTTINGLALSTHTRITGWNDSKESIVRKFIICGRSIDDIHRAYDELCLLANIVDTKTPRAYTLPPQAFFPTQHSGTENRIVVPQHNVGILLGAKGTTIQTITLHTGTWAKFYQADSHNNHKPTFSIRGFYHQDVQKALQKILHIIESSTTHLTQPVSRTDDEEPISPSTHTTHTTQLHVSPTDSSTSNNIKRVSFKRK